MKSPTTRTLTAGMACVGLAWVGLLALAAVRGREVSAFSIAYNAPITLAFGALALDLAVRGLELGPRRTVEVHGFVILAWAVGGLLLFLRLVAKSIDVSGHMTWAILLGVQCVVTGAPKWFTAFVWCIALQVLLLKVFVLGGESGTWGLLAGTILAGGLAIATRSLRAASSV